MTSEPKGHVDYRRLARRDLRSLLRYKFLHEYGYDKGAVVVDAIVADIVATIDRYYRRAGDLEPGQLIYPAPAATERGGRAKTMARTRLVPVRLSLITHEDIEAICAGRSTGARRELRVRRLSHEASRQGALLSQADLGLLLGCSPSAESLTTVGLRERGEFLPLRGFVADMGSFPTHKAAIIRLYLAGELTSDIARRTHHSKEAVDRYIRGFERVRLLAPRFAPEELPLLTGMAAGVVDQYLALLQQHGLRDQEVGQHAHSG